MEYTKTVSIPNLMAMYSSSLSFYRGTRGVGTIFDSYAIVV